MTPSPTPTRPLVAAALAVALTIPLTTPAHAFTVEPFAYGGCHLTATQGDVAVLRDSERAFADQVNRLVKERIAGVRAADVDAIAAHGRATQDSTTQPPANIQAAIERVTAAADAANAGYPGGVGMYLLYVNAGSAPVNQEQLRNYQGQWGYAQAKDWAGRTGGQYGMTTTVVTDAPTKYGQSEAMAAIRTDALHAAGPAAQAYQARETEALNACAQSRALHDDATPLPAPEYPADMLYQGAAGAGFQNAVQALMKGQFPQALKFLIESVKSTLSGLGLPTMFSS
ncbi:hypothetical protein [Corynebacterium cystitidis]|uniref:Uncharacterized protein n=1 Tax=Corynebacterium cystitidis DSM 20524 TaxID=1121357 RepID=A0A1H9REJ2_9CORY|nr:hypothetical protein [Corynebacterium cystitidis]WJY81460.1 hypothetical protein CCYS_02435 [Corynebacterium cystitidis DSM 20524]SER71166.1 hypothetical protein SAMN05661109_00870 [Corynebacterium cystitidis DSM 20524]SNV87300.1 Uncharacterised protein [Corynebacterium cystitidis]